jgi:hypothetical protein
VLSFHFLLKEAKVYLKENTTLCCMTIAAVSCS